MPSTAGILRSKKFIIERISNDLTIRSWKTKRRAAAKRPDRLVIYNYRNTLHGGSSNPCYYEKDQAHSARVPVITVEWREGLRGK